PASPLGSGPRRGRQGEALQGRAAMPPKGVAKVPFEHRVLARLLLKQEVTFDTVEEEVKLKAVQKVHGICLDLFAAPDKIDTVAVVTKRKLEDERGRALGVALVRLRARFDALQAAGVSDKNEAALRALKEYQADELARRPAV
ncbi:unnamed protein product, partial [Prorocentrum cordatum]